MNKYALAGVWTYTPVVDLALSLVVINQSIIPNTSFSSILQENSILHNFTQKLGYRYMCRMSGTCQTN